LLIAAIGTIVVGITNPFLHYAGTIATGEAIIWTLDFGAVSLIAAITAVVVVIADPTLLYATSVAAGELIGAAGLVYGTNAGQRISTKIENLATMAT